MSEHMNLSEPVDVCLVCVPFTDVAIPSMSLSLFKSALSARKIKSCVDYENMHFAKKLGLKACRQIAMTNISLMTGEIIFSRLAHGTTKRSLPEYIEWLFRCRLPLMMQRIDVEKPKKLYFELLTKFQKQAEEFLEEAAARVLARNPKIVAVCSMFQQNNAAIALMRRIKKERPDIITMVGGANCMGSAGVALLKYIEAFDYVFFGESDETFPPLCEKILATGKKVPASELPFGVLGRDSAIPSAPIHRVTENLEAVPCPDFDDFVETYRALDLPDGEMQIMIEGSRGCWWGEKHPCKFCGLNGPSRAYRQKTSAHLADEIAFLEKRYSDVKYCLFTDNIMSYEQMKALPPLMKEKCANRIQLFVETKSNVTEDDIARLRGANFIKLQPGIESLQDDLLRVMNKGCRAIRQVEMLKHSRKHKMDLTWNLLCGFPGEKEEYFSELAALLPKITHLPPPNGFNNIIFQKHSEYTEHQEKYGLDLRPTEGYDFVSPANDDYIAGIAYNFEPKDKDARTLYYDHVRRGQAYKDMIRLVNEWMLGKEDPDRLEMERTANGVEVYDLRRIARRLVYHLDGAAAALMTACRATRKKEGLYREAAGKFSTQEIDGALKYLEDENLILHIGDEYLTLAIER